jgi:hypothetical protein
MGRASSSSVISLRPSRLAGRDGIEEVLVQGGGEGEFDLGGVSSASSGKMPCTGTRRGPVDQLAMGSAGIQRCW